MRNETRRFEVKRACATAGVLLWTSVSWTVSGCSDIRSEERTGKQATSYTDGATTAPAIQLSFGVYQTDKPSVMFKMFDPIARHLSGELANRLGKSVDVKLTILPTYEDGLRSIVEGEVDFVRVGPATYVLARRANPGVQLIAMERKKGERTFSGVIAVKANSPIKELGDLRGKRFAFGDSNSTIGRFLAQAALVDAGVLARDLAKFDFLGRHDIVAKAVEMGDFDAGALKMGTFKKMNKAGHLRVLHEFKNVTKPWIARSDLPEAHLKALHAVLVELRDEQVLAKLKVSDFVAATDADYAMVRAGMAKAEKFDRR